MDKQEAMARITAIEDEAKRLKAIIDAPDADDRKIIGKACFVSDDYEECPYMGFMVKINNKFRGGWIEQDGTEWAFARPATFAELGYPWVEDAKKLIKSIVDAGVGHHVHLCEARRIAAMMEE
jgi:hypothetical protein